MCMSLCFLQHACGVTCLWWVGGVKDSRELWLMVCLDDSNPAGLGGLLQVGLIGLNVITGLLHVPFTGSIGQGAAISHFPIKCDSFWSGIQTLCR